MGVPASKDDEETFADFRVCTAYIVLEACMANCSLVLAVHPH